ncbi:hypothetical protein LAZ67_3003757 [Cordylochernes scorpioides]|uniref:Uncharacterized protein n=1 Tax=Cordylochernes scorpioides TaxID=51811 RepID=A0ABY6KC02_9ARAC|nr:hypothetical protein LAZ67_3003757 [Cordylochernes scorpioides]
MNCTSASQMWQKLLAIHEQKSEFTIGLLWQQFFDARLTSETISDYIAKIENISARISQMGGTITEDQKVAKILNTLPSSMRYFVAAWESLDPKAQTLNNLTARLLIKETRNQQSGSSKQDEALLHRQAGTKPKDTQRSFQDAKKNTKCHYCHKIGHWSRECRKRLANEKNKSKNLHDSKGSSSDYGLILCDNQVEPNDIWYADSGASCSMTFRREWFKTYTPFTSDHPIYLGDNSTLLAEGMGDIEIQAYVDGGWYPTYIRNVLYSPQLKKNLYSLSTSTRRGFNVIIKHDKLQIFMDNDLKAVGVRHDDLYRMLFKVTSSSQGYITSENKLQLWHERLAHLPVATLREMATKGLVDGLQPQDLEGDFFFCEGCQLGKAHRKSCYPSDGKNYQLGEFIYADICGPMQTQSLSKYLYFCLFKDYFSGYRHIYFIKNKSDVLDIFKEYATLIYTQTGNKIKVLRTDNALEFKSDNFADLCKRFGIIHEFTAPYVHEQIGRIERDYRTIVEAARSMLNSRNLPGFFWAEACNTATNILNRSATKQTPGTTPYELFFGTKPNVANYKIFGCNAYMHIPKENRKKWDNKSIKLMFLGYENTSKNFRLWDWKTRKIRISKDVTFDEKATTHSDRESTKPKEIIFQINSAPDESPVATTNIPVQEMLPVSDISSHPMITRSKVSNSQCNFALADEPSNYIDAITSSDSDDGIILSKDKEAIAIIMDELEHAFDITSGSVNFFVGLQIEQSEDRASIFIHQSSYIDKILSKFNMADCIPASVHMDPSVILTKQDCPTPEQKEKMPKFPFREAVGSLMFASCVSRPDITYAVSQVSKFLEYPGPAHCTTVKNIFRYLKGTPHMGILFTGQDQLVGYSDSDFARDVDSRKSTTGYAFMMNGGTVSWASQRQPIIALSTTESEYIAACSAAKELIWIRRLLQGIGCDITKETELFIDNQAAIKLVENPVFHKRTKHIDVRYHFIRSKHEEGELKVHHVCSSEQLADIMTKPLPRNKFHYLRGLLNILDREGCGNPITHPLPRLPSTFHIGITTEPVKVDRMTEDSNMQRMTEAEDEYFADALTNMQPHCDDLVSRLTDAIRGLAMPRAEEALIPPFDGSYAANNFIQQLERTSEGPQDDATLQARLRTLLKGEPLSLYNELNMASLPYNQAKQTLMDLYPGKSEVTFTKFLTFKLNNQIQLGEYYRQKITMGLQLGLTNPIIVEALTEGLQANDQRLMRAIAPKTLTEWYSTMTRIKGTNSLPNPSEPFQGVTNTSAFHRDTGIPSRGRNYNPFSTNNTPRYPSGARRPPSPCKYCQDQREIQEQVGKMLEYDIIEPSFSPYSSPVTLVTKKDKTKRFCVDYRRLNEIIFPDVHPLPLIENILDKLANAKIYSRADFSSAYWSIEISPPDRNLLSFVTLEGQYNFKRLPYGIKIGPQVYERAVNQILQRNRLGFIAHYFDDFIIFSNSIEEHLDHLQQFFDMCNRENFRLNYNKCDFFKTTIEILGYTISSGTYTPLVKNLDVINAIKVPTSVKSLQSFLGSISVYNKFIKDHARIRNPLNNLLKKDTPWHWNAECQHSFDTLKECLTTKPVLHLFKEGLPCQLFCDASLQGIAGILKQQQPDGTLHPVQYYSRALRPHEKNYTITELECLAVIDSVEKFRIYLAGVRFTIFTDHHTLQWLKTIKKIQRCGRPKRLLSDRAPAFTSPKFRRFLIKNGIQPLLTTANNPQANDLCERLNARLTGKLRLLNLENPGTSWTKLIKIVTNKYNDTPHTITGFPPVFLMYNIIPSDLNNHINPYPNIIESRRLAIQRTNDRHDKEKIKYDNKHKNPHFDTGDLVLVKAYHHPNSGKLVPYFTGPYKITEIISDNVVRINRPNRITETEDRTAESRTSHARPPIGVLHQNQQSSNQYLGLWSEPSCQRRSTNPRYVTQSPPPQHRDVHRSWTNQFLYGTRLGTDSPQRLCGRLQVDSQRPLGSPAMDTASLLDTSWAERRGHLCNLHSLFTTDEDSAKNSIPVWGRTESGDICGEEKTWRLVSGRVDDPTRRCQESLTSERSTRRCSPGGTVWSGTQE